MHPFKPLLGFPLLEPVPLSSLPVGLGSLFKAVALEGRQVKYPFRRNGFSEDVHLQQLFQFALNFCSYSFTDVFDGICVSKKVVILFA